MLIMLFSLIFIGVGSTSLAYAQSFGSVLKDYCIQKCAESALLKDDDPVGCDCKPEPGRTTLPTQVFLVRDSPIVRARTLQTVLSRRRARGARPGRGWRLTMRCAHRWCWPMLASASVPVPARVSPSRVCTVSASARADAVNRAHRHWGLHLDRRAARLRRGHPRASQAHLDLLLHPLPRRHAADRLWRCCRRRCLRLEFPRPCTVQPSWASAHALILPPSLTSVSLSLSLALALSLSLSLSLSLLLSLSLSLPLQPPLPLSLVHIPPKYFSLTRLLAH